MMAAHGNEGDAPLLLSWRAPDTDPEHWVGAGRRVSARGYLKRFPGGLSMREGMDEESWRHPGRFKAGHRKVSLADCFCAALVNRIGGEVMTAEPVIRVTQGRWGVQGSVCQIILEPKRGAYDIHCASL